MVDVFQMEFKKMTLMLTLKHSPDSGTILPQFCEVKC